MKIIFIGSAAFAVPSLETLTKTNHEILEVVTQPDKPAGRGMEIRSCPVAEFANKNHLKLFQPISVKKTDVIEHFKKLGPDLVVVVAYGKILPKDLLNIPPLGCINVHASLLPKYRGAAPINWAIVNGEKETGVTTQKISEELDAGDVLLLARTPIGEKETSSELYERLSTMGAKLLIETIEKIEHGKIKPTPQDHSKATYAPIIKKEDGRIDWSLSAAAILNRIRGFYPWPGTFMTLDGKQLKIYSANVIDRNVDAKCGEIIEAGEKFVITCGCGALELLEVQLEGKRRMNAKDFLRGYKK